MNMPAVHHVVGVKISGRSYIFTAKNVIGDMLLVDRPLRMENIVKSCLLEALGKILVSAGVTVK